MTCAATISGAEDARTGRALARVLGRAVRGMVTSDWRQSELEQRALAEAVGSTGGFVTFCDEHGELITATRLAGPRR